MKEIKFLKSAMVDFRYLKLKGLAALRTEHDNFRTVQSRYFIPREFCMLEQFFREVQTDRNVLYWKRCCSMVDFYNMCCMDTPFFKYKKRPDKREIIAAMDIPRKREIIAVMDIPRKREIIAVMDIPRKREPQNIAPNAIEEVNSSHSAAQNTQQPQRQESVMQPHR